jgi:hypothetical protein
LVKGEYIDPKKDPMGNREKNFYDKKTKTGEEVTLADLVWQYGRYDQDKFVQNESKKEFNFGNESTTFMNEFRDMMEAAILVYGCTTGKVEVKDPEVWGRNLKDKLGMLNGIEINGSRALSYSRDPEVWRDCIIGSFGVDMERLSSDYIRMKVDIPKGASAAPAYNLYINNFLHGKLRLSDGDINLNQVMRKLGVSLNQGESAEGIMTTIKNIKEWELEGMKTRNLLNKVSNRQDLDGQRARENYPANIKDIIDRVGRINETGLNEDARRIYRDIKRAIASNNVGVLDGLWKGYMKVVSSNRR